ncbi:magnesium and cobalt transport protein CorA [Cellulomonas alba]|uniref:Magnesium and cobalt transport protein CorA n=1 Tax=Cellulomonas alba TaxID=3053467 RepID=A0ABT7SJM3_9CELL|nr:magnesium and cobalt transport protein CorA [Cellulomonas alba]MDM7856387.1 magnesium and cobalt transport protein CorA [Cellulomonas alba]
MELDISADLDAAAGNDRIFVPDGDGWRELGAGDDVPRSGPRWVVVADARRLTDVARAHGVGEPALSVLNHRGLGEHAVRTHRLRAHVERVQDDEIVLTTPTLSYVEETRDVHTGAVSGVLCREVVVTTEVGDAGVLDEAAEKLTSNVPVPDSGTHQVLAAILLTFLSTASDVEVSLGDAVAKTERMVFSSAAGQDPIERIYDLKREIAEARRALQPVTSVLPELLANVQASGEDAVAEQWLRRAENWVDRLDSHLDSHDALLDAMISVHLSQVSVRQNEDMRKISAWAAMGLAPTLIAGIYGMNFRNMPELDWHFGYPFALGLMVAVCGALYALFRRSGWL